MSEAGPRPGLRAVSGARIAAALTAELRTRIGEERFGLDGRLREWTDGLLPELRALARGRGAGLDPHGLRVPWSPQALLANSFLHWSGRGLPPLPGVDGRGELHFQLRCPTGVRGAPPVVPVLAVGTTRVVAVLAAGPEALLRRPRRLAMAYAETARKGPLACWGRLALDALAFRHVDVGALFRLALALHATFPDHHRTVLHLHLEPEDAGLFDATRRLRGKLAALAEALAGAPVRFAALSFLDLWRQWLEGGEGTARLAARLLGRYAVRVAPRLDGRRASV
ncbi:hypothetical protein HRbin39_01820 [bacterium HR39]|nr:hypothetical protein HRbin39_01820 [bacterium HR39]